MARMCADFSRNDVALERAAEIDNQRQAMTEHAGVNRYQS